MELAGPLWLGVLPGVLQSLYVGRRTGVLSFTRGSERRAVRFRGGNIVNADTDVKEDHLGAVLVQKGVLSEADVRRAAGFALRDGKRMGPVLIELGLLDRSGLEDALALHVDAVLSKVFGWTEGRYEFREETEAAALEGEVTPRVATGELILRAARCVTDPDVVRYNLGDMERVLTLSSDPLLRFQRISLTPVDGYVLSRVDGTLTAHEVVKVIPVMPEEVRSILFGLLSTGVIEFAGARKKAAKPGTEAPRPAQAAEIADELPSEPTLVSATELGATAASPPATPAAPGPSAEPTVVVAPVGFGAAPASLAPSAEPTTRMPAFRDERPLSSEPTLLMSASVEGPSPPVAPASPAATARPVDPAPAEAGAPKEAPPSSAAKSAPRPERTEPARGEATIVVHGFEPGSSARPQRMEVLDAYACLDLWSHFELLGIPHDATEAQVKEAYFRLAKRFHPDQQHDPALSDLRDKLEDVFIRLGEAYEVLRNPRVRASYERSLSRRGRAGRPAKAEVPVDEVIAQAAERIAKEKYWEAIPMLEAAVPRAEGLVKQQGRILLARAYARNPDWVKQAEELLLAVIQQAPDNAEAQLQLGQIYLGQGLRSRALTAFRKALDHDPSNGEAKARVHELEQPSGPEAKKGLVKKLLRKR